MTSSKKKGLPASALMGGGFHSVNIGHDCPRGCGSWTSGRAFTWRGRDSRICEGCARSDERKELVESTGVPVVDVNRRGLGDRRGLAIEENRTGSFPSASKFVVYLDGRELFRRNTWERAYLDGAARAIGIGGRT